LVLSACVYSVAGISVCHCQALPRWHAVCVLASLGRREVCLCSCCCLAPVGAAALLNYCIVRNAVDAFQECLRPTAPLFAAANRSLTTCAAHRRASRRRAGGNRLAHRCTQPCCLFRTGCLARVNALPLKLCFTRLRSTGRLCFCVSARHQVVDAKDTRAGQDLAACDQPDSSVATLTSEQPASSPALFSSFDSTGSPV